MTVQEAIKKLHDNAKERYENKLKEFNETSVVSSIIYASEHYLNSVIAAQHACKILHYANESKLTTIEELTTFCKSYYATEFSSKRRASRSTCTLTNAVRDIMADTETDLNLVRTVKE
jgi:hypothetical protein